MFNYILIIRFEAIHSVHSWYQQQVILQLMERCNHYLTLLIGFHLLTEEGIFFTETCQSSVFSIYVCLTLCIWLLR